ALDDLLRGQTLGDRQVVLDHLALDDDPHHIAKARLFGEHILAGLQILARLAQPNAAYEHPGLVDHALFVKQFGDVAAAEPPLDADGLVALEGTGRVEALTADREHEAGGEGYDQHQGEDRAADDDDRVTRTRGWTIGFGHALGLQRGTRTTGRDPLRVNCTGI